MNFIQKFAMRTSLFTSPQCVNVPLFLYDGIASWRHMHSFHCFIEARFFFIERPWRGVNSMTREVKRIFKQNFHGSQKMVMNVENIRLRITDIGYLLALKHQFAHAVLVITILDL